MGDTHRVGDPQSVSTVNTDRTDEWQFYKPRKHCMLHKGARKQQCPRGTHISGRLVTLTGTTRVAIHRGINLWCNGMRRPSGRANAVHFQSCRWCHFCFSASSVLHVARHPSACRH